jgi:predicted nucleic acid-binding protein
MTYPAIALVDSGILYAYYSAKDRYHPQVRRFFKQLYRETDYNTTVHYRGHVVAEC